MTNSKHQSLKIGIDASRNRSGGAKAHLIGILSELQPERFGIAEVHVWTYQSLNDMLPNVPWLFKHCPKELESSLSSQLLWQWNSLPKELIRNGCDILFASDASTVCQFQPMVVLSQDLLSYEPNIMAMYPLGAEKARLLAILLIQNLAFRRAIGTIFLTNYAAKVIQSSCGRLKTTAIIPHGVDDRFRNVNGTIEWRSDSSSVRCVYVSPIVLFKNHVNVVRAFEILRNRGKKVDLILAGTGTGIAKDRLIKQIDLSDPNRGFIKELGAVSYEWMPQLLSEAEIFVFASSCETFGITLLEGMSAGLPIACSSRSSLPETLENGGIYFDPASPASIAEAIEELLDNRDIRIRVAMRARELSEKYTWEQCSNSTFGFIADLARQTR
jgi:glycosyltransferase involved in cell wall biosynthesis